MIEFLAKRKSFIASIKLSILFPFFILVFGYIFSVATDVLEAYKYSFRVAVAVYFLFISVVSTKSKISLSFLLGELILLTYLIIIYLLNNSSIVINFIFILLAIHFFYVSAVSKYEFLACSLVAHVVIFFIFIAYIVFSGADLTSVVIGDRERYYWGVSNPNKAGFFLFSLLTLFVMNYLYFKISFWILILSILPILYLLVMTGSKTAIFSILIFFALILFRVKFKKNLLFGIPIFFLILSFMASSYYDNLLVNSVLSNRPVDFHNFLSTLSLNNYFFGAHTNGLRIDNSYLQAYFNLGFFAYAVFVILFVKAVSRLDRVEVAYVVTFFVYGLFEGVLVRPDFLLTLFIYYLLFARDRVRLCS
ncbi:MAG: hypothetical protein KC484_09905 [Colwelliaceae bacterium]|nr:hypothetical protein [Colwelliaceae bacterium]